MADRVKWAKGRKNDFAAFMHFEINRATSARAPLEQKWRDYMTNYRAKSNDAVSHFPFEGASNRTVPVTAMNVDPVAANFMSSIHAPENLWTLTPLNEKWIRTAKPLQDFLQWLDRHVLKMWDVNMRLVFEMLKLGTGIYKSTWLWETKDTFGYDNEWNRERQRITVSRPAVDHVHLADFLLPPEALEIEPDKQGGAMWVAQRHHLRLNQLKTQARGQEPFLPNYDPEAVTKVAASFDVSLTDDRHKRHELDDVSATMGGFLDSQQVQIWEIHARYDTTGSGVEEDIIVHYHAPTSTILRATYNWLPGRPFSAVRYLRGDGFYGIGIGEQSEVWQDTISDVMNFSIDKLLLSNTPMLAVQNNANILPDEPIFPGKIWALDNPKDDIVPIQMLAQGNFEMLQFLSFLQDISKTRTGVGDLQQGNIAALPSRTPATSVQSLLAEGKSRFDMSIKDQRIGGLSEVGLRILQHLQFQTQNFANNPFATAWAETAMRILGNPEGQSVAEALSSVPAEPVEEGIGVQLTATSGANNKELQKQSSMGLLSLMGQLAPGFIQLAQVISQDPGGPVGKTAQKLFLGGADLLQNVMEQHDIRNPEAIVPDIQDLQGSQQGQGAVPFGSEGGRDPFAQGTRGLGRI